NTYLLYKHLHNCSFYAIKSNAEICRVLLSHNCHSTIWDRVFQRSTQRYLQELEQANAALSLVYP
ncbi:MAG: hypothetical protein K6G30_03425, partial [Acetatifactor sp.]|nr:hypothetical protein [Acetatifactor sp.]